ncbi:MAG: hypothetical protein JWR26_3235 [Pedosphaera sp.]|nr:hypothetical protein [Pedosphaera sp.]
MKPIFTVLLLLMSMFALSPACRADELDDQYLAILSTIQQGDTLGEKGQWTQALVKYTEAQAALKQFQHDNPLWSAKLVKYRMTYVAGKVSEVTPKAASGETVDAMEMKLKWQVGKRYLQRIETDQNTDVTMPNSAQPMKQKMKQTQDISISALKERDGGGRELLMEITGEKMESGMGGRTFLNFDSNQDLQKDAGNPAAAMLRKLVNARVTYLTGASGNVEKVEGFEEFMDRVLDKAPAEMQALMKGMFTEDSLKQMGATAQGLPDKPVKVGDTWPVKTELNMGPMGVMLLNSTFTFKRWEQHDNRKCALFESTGDISAKSAGDSQSGAMNVENGKTSSKIWFDPALGMVIDTEVHQEMSIKIDVQGQSLASKINQVINNKLVKVEDISK